MRNTLFYGDNLSVLREQVGDETVDLIYLDPPFNSARNYNLLFKQVKGESSPAQIRAFEDTWQWSAALCQEGERHFGKRRGILPRRTVSRVWDGCAFRVREQPP